MLRSVLIAIAGVIVLVLVFAYFALEFTSQ